MSTCDGYNNLISPFMDVKAQTAVKYAQKNV